MSRKLDLRGQSKGFSDSGLYAGGCLENESYQFDYEEDPDEDYVYLTEGQVERLFDENELQVILATY